MADHNNSAAGSLPPSPAYLAESRVDVLRNGGVIPVVLASVAVLARFYTRVVIIRTWGFDDTLLLLAWIMAWVVAGLALAVIEYGAGRHIQLASPDDLIMLLKLSYFARLCYQLALGLTKLSICVFYLRVFTDRVGQLVTYAIFAFTVASLIPIFVASILECTPRVADAWSIKPDKRCPGNISAIVTSGAVLNIVGDVALMSFVIPRIFRLQLSKKQKYLLLAIVSMSGLIIVAAIMRIAQIYQIISSNDVTWDTTDIGIWSGIEINTGLFCASVISIKPLIRRFWPKFLGTHASPHDAGSHSLSNSMRPKANTWAPLRESNEGARGEEDIGMAMGGVELPCSPVRSYHNWDHDRRELRPAYAPRGHDDADSQSSRSNMVKLPITQQVAHV